MRKTLVLVAVCLMAATSACRSGATSENSNAGGGTSPQTTAATKTAGAPDAAPSPRLTIVSGGGESPLEVKSGAFFKSTQTYSDGGKTETATQAVFRIANFDMEKAKGAKPENGQMVAVFVLVGAGGTDEKAALQPGTYPVRTGDFSKAPKFNITSNCGFVMFAGGAQSEKKLATSKMQGETRISSVTNDSVTGEINVTDGESTIKGTFVAKLAARRD